MDIAIVASEAVTVVRAALAGLVAIESRRLDIADPEQAHYDALTLVVKECAGVLESIDKRLAALETHAVAVSHAPAIEADVPSFTPTAKLKAADAVAADPVMEPPAEPEKIAITITPAPQGS